jgi:hypothetical protein
MGESASLAGVVTVGVRVEPHQASIRPHSVYVLIESTSPLTCVGWSVCVPCKSADRGMTLTDMKLLDKQDGESRH